MDVNCSGGLAYFRFRIGQRILGEHRRAHEAGGRIALIDIKLVLPLYRDEHPGLRRMEVEVARAEAEPIAGRDRGQTAQCAVVEAERLDRAWVLGFVRLGVVAAGYQQHSVVRGRGEDLMRVNAGIELFGLCDLRTDRAVGVEAMAG